MNNAEQCYHSCPNMRNAYVGWALAHHTIKVFDNCRHKYPNNWRHEYSVIVGMNADLQDQYSGGFNQLTACV